MPSLSTTILYAHILVILPILIAYYFSGSSLSATKDTSREFQFHIAEIPISKVLAQNLRLVNHSWEHGVFTHALLELQNPELTVFAGAGYGVQLKNPNPGAELEAFPGGKLPQTGGTRYDPWIRVKGLRHAASVVVTDGSVGPPVPFEEIGGMGDDDKQRGTLRGKIKKDKKRGGWLFYEDGDVGAADAASLGWATLLLERAGAVDVNNPVGVGRNAYGEAADGMVEWLFDESRNARFKLDEWEGWSSADLSPGEEAAIRKEEKQKRIERGEPERWAISHRYDSKQLWADSVFMVPPFLAAYAVARRDVNWLFEAVEQIRVYGYALSVEDRLWRHIQRQDQTSRDEGCCRDDFLWLTGNAWVLGGIVRVLGVLERWHATSPSNGVDFDLVREKRSRAKSDLLKFAHGILDELVKHGKNDETGLLKNYLDSTPGMAPEQWTQATFGDAAGSALVASSVYRLAQFGMLGSQEMLPWADELYNAVAEQISPEGIVGSVADVGEVPCRMSVPCTSEGQSMVLLMYAARRDCMKLGICRSPEVKDWWSWLSSFR